MQRYYIHTSKIDVFSYLFHFQIITLLAVAGLLAGGAYGLSKLEQDFDFNWFMPPSSPPRKFTINSEIVRAIKFAIFLYNISQCNIWLTRLSLLKLGILTLQISRLHYKIVLKK